MDENNKVEVQPETETEHVKLISRGGIFMSMGKCKSSINQVKDCTSKELTKKRNEWKTCTSSTEQKMCKIIKVHP